jgi:uncharacterized protein YjiK
MPLFIAVFCGLTTLYSAGCTTGSFRERADSLFLITDHVSYYYNLKSPDEKHFLPYALAEVSGLTHLRGSRILCVEDERGKVYEYDLKTRKIVNAITFEDSGDFEGVEYVNDTVYVLESDGDIYAFAYTTENSTMATKYENKLAKKNDTEGLGYNPLSGNLLISCKEEEDIKGVDAKGKTVYEFDLGTKELIETPFFEITVEKMEAFFEANRDFDYETERIKFKPSGIAFNPLDNYFYLLASVGKLMIVIDAKGIIMATYPIAPGILGQPEGLFFDPKGNLYISSEGEGDKGYIVKFSAREK